eukprot:6646114-Pyramimonas_sp.AAC.1
MYPLYVLRTLIRGLWSAPRPFGRLHLTEPPPPTMNSPPVAVNSPPPLVNSPPQRFMLSATEAAELAATPSCQFFHDPNMGRK